MRKIFSSGRSLASPQAQNADFVELFFDLVFVYALTRITALTAHHLDLKHVFQSVLIFWLIWWGWTQFTWALNAAHTKLAEVRMMVLIATGVAFLMASSVDYAFQEGVIWFAVPYVLIRVIGLILYIRVTESADGQRSAVILFALVSIAGLLAVLAGIFVSPAMRLYCWFGAILLDMLAGYIGGRADGWKLQPEHFIERHGLIVIIALGESLIVTAAAVSGLERSNDLLIIGALAVMITCLLWWSYFSWLSEYLEKQFSKIKIGSERARAGRDAFSFMHFLIIGGIVGVAVGFEKILQHPHDLVSMPIGIALAAGQFLFVGFSAASVWRTGKLILMPRILILCISTIGVVMSIGYAPVISMSIIAFSLLLINILEWKKCRHD